jgi:hypothetical protein
MAPKYLTAFPKPLLDELVEGRWLPVVGAGMSNNAVVPSGKKMPLWEDLGRSLAAEMRNYDYTTALDAISAYEQQFSRTKLVERLSDLLFVDSAKPGNVHKAFCSIRFPIVCTTNFDFLLEKQYDSNPRYCRPLMYDQQLSIPNRGPGVQLLKLHGDVHHPERLVATEEDYDGFLQRYPLIATYLANLLITKTAVFVGFSLDDPDFRQVFRLIIDRLGRSRGAAYAIRVGSNSQAIARFERRGVKVINIPGRESKYGEILAAVFEELCGYQESAVIPASEVTDEQALRELRLPPGATTRLSFFAVPQALSSLYKESIFPIARQFGFVPITAEAVVSPGDSVTAKIDALLGKANVSVVDLSNDWTKIEFQIALSKLGPERVLVIADRIDAAPAGGLLVLRRPRGAFADAEQFLQEVTNWFAARAELTLPTLEEEPERFLELGYGRAAVIAAMTLFETRLRKRLDLTLEPSRPMSLVQLTRLAVESGLISEKDAELVQGWSRTRNAAVHTTKSIPIRTARAVVLGIRDLLRKLH